MNYEDLRQHTRRQPFQPFKVVLMSGEVLNVWRQDGHVLSRHHLVVGVTNEAGGTDYDSTTMIDLLHVVRIEPLNLPAPQSQGNGQQAT
jgi:hypothetical protein